MWVEVVGPVEDRVPGILAELAKHASLTLSSPALGCDLNAEPGVVVAAEPCADLLSTLFRYRAAGRPVLVVAVSPSVCRETDVWQILAAGASDVVTWGPSCGEVVAARLDRWRELEQTAGSEVVRRLVLGRSQCWMTTLHRLVEVARFTTSPVLLTGESGTGKELAANLIHSLDRRESKGPFVVLDCTTVVPTLSGSEFFGHERGAFTGAMQARDGAVGLADGGTLFLDEVGELPVALQAELLRVIQEGTYKRVGSSIWQRSRFRLVCATNRDLERETNEGRFRSDLLYRISGAVVQLPPLRERADDILLLFQSFLAELLPIDGLPEVTPEVGAYLRSRPFPGNIRELRQLAGRVAIRHVGPGPITPGDLPDEDRPTSVASHAWDPGDLGQAVRGALRAGLTLNEIERAAGDLAVEAALGECGNKVASAAVRLGVSDRAIHYRLKARVAAKASLPVLGGARDRGNGTESDPD